MANKHWKVTAFETIRVTRVYLAEDQNEAVRKMTDWCRAQEDNRGRLFSGTMKVEPAKD